MDAGRGASFVSLALSFAFGRYSVYFLVVCCLFTLVVCVNPLYLYLMVPEATRKLNAL